ncbi:MAG TPA: DUF1992 domain-containing protein [Vicinamibacterales bacterium]|jgi:hypothetical protein|nr:DUF1992 domain-containing protein [Vicinamibacterales bacterium]
MPFENLAERKIREAIAAGEFDRLPNAGQPISLDDYFSVPEHLRMAFSVLRSANCLPEEVQLLNDIARLESALASDLNPAVRSRLSAELREARLHLDVALDRHRSESRVARRRG